MSTPRQWVGRAIRTLFPGPPPSNRILDTYVTRAPHPQNALDIFPGEWASALPGEHAVLKAGRAQLFEDTRMAWAIECLGGVAGKTVLELGPLEAGHSYMLDRAGAAGVLAIEGNTRAYLKCLVVKELLGLPSTRFVCGDFTEYLRAATDRFHVVVASGVLYHMAHPVEVLERCCALSDSLYIWTHYYDAAILGANVATADRVTPPQPASHAGFAHEVYRHDYRQALNHQGFCGGTRPYANWLTRDTIVSALRHFGMTHIEMAFEEPDHANGPAFALVARRGPN